MSLTWNVGERIVSLSFVPYSHMDERDHRLFYDTMNALLTYANGVLHVVGRDRVRIDADDRDVCDDAMRVGERLWLNRGLVDDFVGTNPMGLTNEQLLVAQPWRHALRDVFTCIDAEPDAATYMNGNRIFVIGAMSGDADAHIHTIPSYMLLTLLPFKGGIVTDGKTVHISDEPSPRAIPVIGARARELLSYGTISTANDLIEYSRACGDGNHVSEEMQLFLDESLGLPHVPGRGW